MVLALPLVEVSAVVVDGVRYLVRPDTRVEVRLEYKHSVELVDIVEEYELLGCRIRLVKFMWPGYGAGLPSRVDELTSWSSGDAGGLVLRDVTLNTSVLQLDMRFRVSPRLTVNGEAIRAGRDVSLVACSRVPLIEILFGKWLRVDGRSGGA